MTDLDLDAIEARANAAMLSPTGQQYDAGVVLSTDVPALVAEVRSLRTMRDAAWQHYDEQVAANAALSADRDEVREAIDRGRALHARSESYLVGTIDADGNLIEHALVTDGAPTVFLDDPTPEILCSECRTDWPCATIRALDTRRAAAVSIDPERYVTDLEEQVDSLIRERDDAQSLAAVAREKERAALEERDEALRHLTHAAAVEAALTSDLLAAHVEVEQLRVTRATDRNRLKHTRKALAKAGLLLEIRAEQTERLLGDIAHCEGRSERWRLLAMGWKHRCYTAGDALTDIAILHMQRPCSHGSEPHEPKRASNGEVWCSGPHCRTCGVVAPCGTYLLATRSGEADRP